MPRISAPSVGARRSRRLGGIDARVQLLRGNVQPSARGAALVGVDDIDELTSQGTFGRRKRTQSSYVYVVIGMRAHMF